MTAQTPSGSRLLALLQLIRAPNVFTAIADIAMGVLVVSPTLSSWPGFVALGLASAALYSAGMVLNDICDFEVDSRLRPYTGPSWVAGEHIDHSVCRPPPPPSVFV